MTELRILGPAELRNIRGELEHSFLAGPKRLALLVYLLLQKPRGFHRRDSLLPVFWPEQDQKSARNSLSNMLYHIRKTLGNNIVENRGSEEIAINPNLFWCDAVAFEKAITEKDHEPALKLYRSDLLKGFHIQEASVEFDHWLEQERKRFHLLALEGSRFLAEKAFRRNLYPEAVMWARKASELDPYSEKIHLQLLRYLCEIGEQEEALKEYAAFSHLLNEEFGEEPGQDLQSFYNDIKQRDPLQKVSHTTKNHKEPALQSSIAVLPFESIGIEKASSFTDAIHSDILTRLSQVSDLSVISRTSVRNFKGSSKLLPEIARELQVNWVLTGEVQEIGKQVKVSVRLIEAARDRQVWAEIFQKELSAGEIFRIQSEITHKIIGALKMRLSSKEKKAIKQIPTKDLEAFRLHAHGRWNLDQRSEKAMRLAEEYFRAALARDPQYAQAWLGLADSLSLLHDYSYEKDGQAILPEAEKAAKEALKIDPGLAEAYASLGLLHTTRRNGDAAVYHLKKAVELRPGYAEAHAWLCWIYLLLGNKPGSLENAKKGVEWNPLSQEAVSNLALALLTIRDYENSLKEAKRLILLQPDFTTARFEAGLALYHLGKYGEAIDILKDLSVPWAGNGPLVTMILSYYRSGQKAEAKKFFSRIKNDHFAIGLMQLLEGNNERGVELFLGIEKWDYWEMLSIHYFYPDLLDLVREDHRFKNILSVIGKNWGIPEDAEFKEQQVLAEDNFFLNTSVSHPDKKSIAVMPFKDLGSQEPRFTDGIHGDIISSLSRIKNLHVISRLSVKQYERAEKTATEIAKDFKTAWLLEGEVRQSSTEIEMSMKLIDISGNTVAWTGNYRKSLSTENLFFVQQQVISEILKILSVEFSGKEKQRVINRHTANLDAYRLYSYGRNCLDRRTEAGIYEGLDSFQACLELDPDYALTWSGLADALSLLDFYGHIVPKSSPSSLDAAKKAVALDPELGEARTSLGIAYAGCSNGPAALEEMQKAIDLTPGYAEGHIWLAWLHLVLGRPEAALKPAQKAVRLNPLAPAIRIFLAESHLANNDPEEAFTQVKRAREINPEYGLAYYMEGMVLYHRKDFEEAATAFRKCLTLIAERGTPSRSEVKTALAFTTHAVGDENLGYDLKSRLYKSIDPFPLGMLHALHGELDEAFQSFNRIQDWSSFSVEIMRYLFPGALSTLRQDRRYGELIKKIDVAWGLNF